MIFPSFQAQNVIFQALRLPETTLLLTKWVGLDVLLCFNDLMVRKIRKKASSCPGIFSCFFFGVAYPSITGLISGW